MCCSKKKDSLFSDMVPKSSFAFNKDVAEVFDDMAVRSIPGYIAQQYFIAQYISLLIKTQKAISIVDIGCSTGTTLEQITNFTKKEALNTRQCEMIAMDYSKDMLLQCEHKIKQYRDDWKSIVLMELDLMKSNHSVSDALYKKNGKKDTRHTVVLLHFVLQFLPLSFRASILKDCWSIVQAGGSMFISEKLRSSDPMVQQSWEGMQYSF